MAQGDLSERSNSSAGPSDQASLAAENLRLQEALRRSEIATSEFIDFVAHQLKQPMTSLKGYAQMLLMGIAGDLAPVQRNFVDIIRANADRMDRLVNDLLEVSRLEAGRIALHPSPVGIMDIVDETLTVTQVEVQARHHSLDVDIPLHLPLLLADRQRLVQALTHLVRNACQYTPEGGRIRLTATTQEGGRIRLSVDDTGIGLSPAELALIGTKFYRTDHELVQEQQGNGLGLAVTRHLIALHGAELVIESEPGRGSTFAFSLPVASGQQPPAGG